MEYYRTDDGQIQASLAYRLGVVLQQYNSLKTEDTKYEVSLSLAILQNVQTNCKELIASMTKPERKQNPVVVDALGR